MISNNSSTLYSFKYSGIGMNCPTNTNYTMIDCQCNCNQPLFGAIESTYSGCNCYFDPAVAQSIQCQINIQCGQALPSADLSFSVDSLGNFQLGQNLELNQTSATCLWKTSQYMYSCKYLILIGDINYNWTGGLFIQIIIKSVSFFT